MHVIYWKHLKAEANMSWGMQNLLVHFLSRDLFLSFFLLQRFPEKKVVMVSVASWPCSASPQTQKYGQEKVLICSLPLKNNTFMSKGTYNSGFAEKLNLKVQAVPSLKGHMSEPQAVSETVF